MSLPSFNPNTFGESLLHNDGAQYSPQSASAPFSTAETLEAHNTLGTLSSSGAFNDVYPISTGLMSHEFESVVRHPPGTAIACAFIVLRSGRM